jgi:hypothetical protein
MGHTPKGSDASSTFTFGPPSAQPSPGKVHRRIASNARANNIFQTPADADPMPQDSTSNGLGLFTFTKQLRPNALEFKPGGPAPKQRISPSAPGGGFRPPALDLSAAAPSSRAFASLGKPFEFTPAASKPALVIRKPNPIPILKPKDASPVEDTMVSPHRQHASPREDDAELQPVPSEVSSRV